MKSEKCDILESKLHDEANEQSCNYHVHSAVWISTQGQQHVASPATKEAEVAISFAKVKLIFLLKKGLGTTKIPKLLGRVNYNQFDLAVTAHRADRWEKQETTMMQTLLRYSRKKKEFVYRGISWHATTD
jgi:hypothetical protein